ncbi:MAG: succinylglutamate desuccinylase/aspartoacylase family protein [Patescibacteria group bacterium]|nr:succinylglutamate desuccinylase/aspartoacylase family protein [Patescibacteria group bacterium]
MTKRILRQKNLTIENNGLSSLSVNVFITGQGSPKIAVINGLHGLERTGAYLMPKLLGELKLKSGTVAFIPFANPSSAERNTRLTPEDNQDLNRIFPGNKNGTLSFRLAAALFDYLKDFDVVIDIHTFPKMDMPIIGVFFANIENGLRQKLLYVLKAFNPDFIWKLDIEKGETAKAGSLIEALLKIGVLAFSVETPDVEIINENQERRFVKGVQNLIEVLLKPESFNTQRKILIIARQPSLATSTGFFVPKKTIFQKVKKGEVVGKIINLNGFETETVRATAAGPIVFILKKTFVFTGERVAIVGNIVE